jgi:hypothetical protein
LQNYSSNVRFEVLTAVVMNIPVFWDGITPSYSHNVTCLLLHLAHMCFYICSNVTTSSPTACYHHHHHHHHHNLLRIQNLSRTCGWPGQVNNMVPQAC